MMRADLLAEYLVVVHHVDGDVNEKSRRGLANSYLDPVRKLSQDDISSASGVSGASPAT